MENISALRIREFSNLKCKINNSKTKIMNIRCRQCGEYFCPCDETLDLIAEGYISSDSVNTCDDCWNMIQLSEFDLSESFSDADPEL